VLVLLIKILRQTKTGIPYSSGFAIWQYLAALYCF